MTLKYFRTADGQPLGFSTQSSHLITVRQLFKWLMRQNVLLYNPASELELPKQPVYLPTAVLSVEEAERVPNVPDVREVLGLRDRAILEVLYATGVRRAELIKLGLMDIDSARRVLVVREGKGRKDRVKLAEVHALTHPGAKLGSTTQPAVSVYDDEEEPATGEDLVSRLAAEDEDEIDALEEEG